MLGENAVKVKMDLEGIEDREYSFEIADEWRAAMKAAIRKDLKSESYSNEEKAIRFTYDYELACNDLIRLLLFEIKWLRVLVEYLQDENKG